MGVAVSASSGREVEVKSVRNPRKIATLKVIATRVIDKFLKRVPKVWG
jgi:hypothetical protein